VGDPSGDAAGGGCLMIGVSCRETRLLASRRMSCRALIYSGAVYHGYPCLGSSPSRHRISALGPASSHRLGW
jgi:hypothetical protein